MAAGGGKTPAGRLVGGYMIALAVLTIILIPVSYYLTGISPGRLGAMLVSALLGLGWGIYQVRKR